MTGDDEAREAQQASVEGPAVEDTATDELRERLVNLREEADRIGTLATGAEQVEAAERFAEAAGALDEQIGSAARAAEEDRDG